MKPPRICLDRAVALGLVILAAVLPGYADEGMWLFTAPPRQWLQERYGFAPTAAWLEHLQKASVRFNSGGSGSFVSADGLILSNHHVGADALQKFGDAHHDYYRDGFYARSRSEETPCVDLELNVLMSVEDVTGRVNAVVRPGMSAEEAFAARRAAMAALEKESLARTGLRSDVVTLYQGGQYHLYRYRRYTDVRLVFAPEKQIAFYGGDPDNFEYPRYDLDICLFRAYENGQPARIEHYLTWSPTGVRENELVFVSGHPGDSSRQLTMAELEYLRDRDFPYTLQRLHRLEVLLTTWGARNAENARRAQARLYGVQNSRKAREGMFAGLLDPLLMGQKKAAEARFRTTLVTRADWRGALTAFDEIQQAQAALAEYDRLHRLLEGAHGFHSTLFDIARTLLRAGAERPKPDGERLREFRDANRESLELELFSAEPLYDDYEQLKLADSLTWLVENLPGTNGLVAQVLAGKSPRARAAELVAGTKVKEVAFRRRLYASGATTVKAARDPLIELARLVDPEARRVRALVEAQEELKRQAYARIAAAKFELAPAETYPDATFTLRLACGVAKGYEEDGRTVPWQTTFAGLYERAAAQRDHPPFDLPPRWRDRASTLDLKTPLNFVSTPDIIGGNSGSPVVNRAGEFVGVIFDGNIQSLVLDFIYTEEQARAVAVNAQAIQAALRSIYQAPELAEELLTGRAR